MKSRDLLLFLVFVSVVSYSQKSKYNRSFNTGGQFCSNYNKQPILMFQIDCPVGEIQKTDVQQRSILLFDANVLQMFHTKQKNRYTVMGLSFNQKGFEETGMKGNWDEQIQNYKSYSQIYKICYAGVIVGQSFVLTRVNKFCLELMSFLNPEWKIAANSSSAEAEYFRHFAVNTRLCLNLEYRINDNYTINVSPFFQSALFNYNKTIYSRNRNSYLPYSFGLNLGFGF